MRAHGVYIQSAMINQIGAWLRPVGSNEACAGGKTFSRRLPGARYAGATGIPGTTSSVPGPVKPLAESARSQRDAKARVILGVEFRHALPPRS